MDRVRKTPSHTRHVPSLNFTQLTLPLLSRSLFTVESASLAFFFSSTLVLPSLLSIITLFNKLDPRLTAFRRRPPPSLSLRLANNSTVSVQWLLRLPLTCAGNTCWQTGLRGT